MIKFHAFTASKHELIPKSAGTKQCSKKCQEEWQDRTNNESVLEEWLQWLWQSDQWLWSLCVYFLICKIGVQFFPISWSELFVKLIIDFVKLNPCKDLRENNCMRNAQSLKDSGLE